MKLQYILDSSGKTTGVFIPISEWNEIKAKYKGIDQGQTDIQAWQMEEVRGRLENYKNNPNEVMDLDMAIDDIEKALLLLKNMKLSKLIRMWESKEMKEVDNTNWLKFKGAMTKRPMEEINQQLNELRKEWE